VTWIGNLRRLSITTELEIAPSRSTQNEPPTLTRTLH